MSINLPQRSKIESIVRIVSDLEKKPAGEEESKPRRFVKRRQKNLKNYSGNFEGSQRSRSLEADKGIVPNKDLVSQLKEELMSKDVYIEKLIDKIKTLFECNNEYADETERLQREKILLIQNFNNLQENYDSFQAKTCENCILLQSAKGDIEEENHQYISENRNLKNDLKMMKILVYRLNVQLERHQDIIRDIYPEKRLTEGQNKDSKDSLLLFWGTVNSHTLGPLMTAYDDILNEKTELAKQYEIELNAFTGKLKYVLEENEQLQNQSESIRQEHELWLNDRSRLESQVELFRNKAEVQAKRADLAREKLLEVLKCYDQKVQAQMIDIERLQEAYSRTRNELTHLKNSQPVQPPEIADSLKECQKLFEELKLRQGEEKDKLVEEIKLLRMQLEDKENNLKILAESNKCLQEVSTKQKEYNEMLTAKITATKVDLARVRSARDALKSKFHNFSTWDRRSEPEMNQLKSNWGEVREKEIKAARSLQIRQNEELEKLTAKLKHRDETLKKILKDKITLCNT